MNGRSYAKIIEQDRLCEGIFRLRLAFSDTDSIRPGQFFNLYLDDGRHLLPRPISVCEAEGGVLTLVYRVVGFGTEAISKMLPGESLWILGPLGNGYSLDWLKEDSSVLAVGGGLGIPPMLFLTHALAKQGISVGTVLGFRDEGFLLPEFEEAAPSLYLSSDSGRIGEKGTVIDLLETHHLKPDVIFSCGPLPMLRALKDFAAARQIRLFVSLEERMACGIGACLACVCSTTELDDHSRVHNRRVCKDGPVFDAEEVAL